MQDSDTSIVLDYALSEFSRRRAGYFDEFPISLDGEDARGSTAWQARAACETHLTARGLLRTPSLAPASDPFGMLMVKSAFDAPVVAKFTRSHPVDDVLLLDALGGAFELRKTRSGVRFFAGNRGTRILVIINAVGMSLAFWKSLILDREHDFRILFIESPGGDLLNGGVHTFLDIAADAASVLDVLTEEGVSEAHLLTWSNGCHVGLEVARRSPSICSLILLSPSIVGKEGWTVYERNLMQISQRISENPALSAGFSKMFSESSKHSDIALSHDPVTRARSLFPLPSSELARCLNTPFVGEDYLVNFSRRMVADTNTMSLSEKLCCPTLLITGANDHLVDSEASVRALMKAGSPFTWANVYGAGHYIADLQYNYFMWLVDRFTRHAPLSGIIARVAIASL